MTIEPHPMKWPEPEPDRLDELCKEIGLQTPRRMMPFSDYGYCIEQVLIYLLEREKERQGGKQ